MRAEAWWLTSAASLPLLEPASQASPCRLDDVTEQHDVDVVDVESLVNVSELACFVMGSERRELCCRLSSVGDVADEVTSDLLDDDLWFVWLWWWW